MVHLSNSGNKNLAKILIAENSARLIMVVVQRFNTVHIMAIVMNTDFARDEHDMTDTDFARDKYD